MSCVRLWQIKPGRCLLLCLLLMLGGCVVLPQGAAVTTRTPLQGTKGLKKGLDTQQILLVLEPQVEYLLQRFSYDPVLLTAENDRIRQQLSALLSQGVLRQGFNAISAGSGPDSVSTPAVSALLMQRLFANYRQLMERRETPGDPLPSLGPVVNLLSAPLNGELLLLSRFSGLHKSTALQRKELITASLRTLVSLGRQRQVVLPREYGELELALLDGVTGQVYWSAYTTGRPDQLPNMTRRLLTELQTQITHSSPARAAQTSEFYP